MEKARKMGGNWLLRLVAFSGLALLAALIWFITLRLEGEPPRLQWDVTSPLYLGKSVELPLTVADPKSGLRRLHVVLNKDGKDVVLGDIAFPTAGWLGLEKIQQETTRIKIDPAAMGLTDGKALLRIALWDHSWRNWWHGNLTDLQTEVVIDTRPPAIENLTPQNYVNQGGAGLAVYRLSEPCPTSGVRVGTHFFPGYSGYYPDKAIHIAFFGMSHLQGAGTEIVLEARDAAGNSSRTRWPYHFRKKAFKKDALQVSDGFINQILPEFHALLPAKPNASLKEKFLFINRELRQANYEQIVAAAGKTENAILWKGPFLRLPNSAPRAGFADHRTYLYEGKEIDQQDHLGVDLASLARSPVPAANNGVVVFTGFIGIYGQTVIVDHGFGLFSMYSHLSQIAVKAGERVAKEAILGHTGSTGLAVGDHLHFSILVRHLFVDPIEWWDPHWIQDNVTLKLDSVRSSSGQAG
ncbi:MAG: M23 family metallopeptidase [Desulfobacterales bacterium]|nr:M23 family metallopeptidase [Desulfobacterales bacterium]